MVIQPPRRRATGIGIDTLASRRQPAGSAIVGDDRRPLDCRGFAIRGREWRSHMSTSGRSR